MDHLFRDIRLGLRTLIKSPGLTIVSVIALMFGIGLTTMMFSIIYGAMLRGLPYPDGDKILIVWRSNPAQNVERQSLPIQDFADYRAQQRSFEIFGAYTSGTMNVSGTERAERYAGTWITAGVFGMTGVRPLLGRDFLEGESAPGGAKVAILGHAMWQERFGGAASVLGTSMRVNGAPYEIVGVMPPDFDFPDGGQLWLPLQTDPLVGRRGDGQFVQTVGKLRAGLTIDDANVEMATIAARLAADHPETNKDYTAYSTGFVDAFIGDEPRQLLWTMLGAVFFVLLIACSNVANLLLDRAAHRSKEVGVRTALGASRGQVVRMFLAEALLLAVGGAVLGIVLAKVGIDAFNRAIVSTDPPSFIDIRLFPPVLLFAIGVSLLATLLAGLIPAIQSSRSDIAEVLKDESRGASSLRIGKLSKVLVVFEIALSCGLLVAAGLMIKSVTKAQTRDTGFTSADVFTARVGFPVVYTDTVAQLQFFTQLAERVGEIPGVRAAAVASGLPGAQQGFNGNRVALDGATYERTQDLPNTRGASVTPGFFAALDIPLRQGRLFTDGDRAGALPVAIVNERFVRQHLSGGDALGRRVRLGSLENPQPWLTIVGVVPDVFAGDPEDPRPAVVFRPFAQARTPFAYIVARTPGPPLSLAQPVRDAVASLNPDLPIYWSMTLDEAIAEPLWFVRVFGTMFMIFGLVALFLASIGLYAVMSFAVSRRTREVGIRMALGATPRRVVRLIFNNGAWQLGLGLGIGLLLAAGISRLLTMILFDVQPLDPAVFGGVAAVLAITGMIACFIPARRATRVDPADAMRAD
ncbi:MAG: ABC transporter permease [Gemmatimonadaceae bacterium]